jgi:hypothetical protein
MFEHDLQLTFLLTCLLEVFFGYDVPLLVDYITTKISALGQPAQIIVTRSKSLQKRFY